MAVADTPTTLRSRWLRLPPALRYPQYRRYWLGNLFSVSSLQIMWVAQGWLVYQLTGSELYLGYAGVASALPAIVLNLFGGVVADRLDQRRVIFICQLLVVGVVGVLATLTAAGVVEPWHVLVGAFITGSLQAFNNPARQSIFPRLLDRKDLPSAVSLNAFVWQGTRVVAPATGGLIIGAFGVAAAFYICAIGFLALGAAAITLTPASRPERPRGATVLGDLGQGIGFIRGNGLFSFLISMTFFNSFFGMAAIQLLPVFANNVLDIGSSGLGLLYSAGGVGSLVGFAIISWLGNYEKRGQVIIAGGSIFGLCLVVFGLSTWLPLSILALFATGCFNTIYMIAVQQTLQMRVPNELRGRVMGIYGMTWNLAPMGAIQAGALATAFGPGMAVVTGGLAVTTFALAVATSNARIRGLSITREAAPAAG